jgi:SAM-dependent methyltransferase
MTWEEAVLSLRSHPDADELVKACFYDDPLGEAALRYWKSTEWQAVRRLLPAAPGVALDVGAGRGISAYALARDGWSVTALEPDPSAIVGAEAIRQLASQSRLDIDVKQEWGENLPFADGRFDVVHCRQVLHHARDLAQLCREIGRVLRPGGLLVATREHVVSRRADVPAFQRAHPLHRLYGGENAFLLSEYVGCIEAAGLRVEQQLNPYQSDINLYPRTMQSLREQFARKLRLPRPALLPQAALGWIGRVSNSPGRLYTFVARKARHG